MRDGKATATAGNSGTCRTGMSRYVPAWKRNRCASAICAAARDARIDARIVVCTVGLDTCGQGDGTLKDCAGSSTPFHDIDAIEISQASCPIAQQINQLRLTQ
jgi:hypothetical protein